MDDVDETGWGAPDHLWVLRHIRIDVIAPPVDDDWVELRTWCSGTAPVAAGRRMSLAGDRGGRIELDSVWVHLGPDARPSRIGEFGAYAAAAGDRVVSPRVELPHPPDDGDRTDWPLRATDIDLLGHVNNAAYWLRGLSETSVGRHRSLTLHSQPKLRFLCFRISLSQREERR